MPAIYSRALTIAEVQARFNQGSVSPPTPGYRPGRHRMLDACGGGRGHRRGHQRLQSARANHQSRHVDGGRAELGRLDGRPHGRIPRTQTRSRTPTTPRPTWKSEATGCASRPRTFRLQLAHHSLVPAPGRLPPGLLRRENPKPQHTGDSPRHRVRGSNVRARSWPRPWLSFPRANTWHAYSSSVNELAAPGATASTPERIMVL